MKPMVKLTGEDGNVFNLIAIASRALKDSGLKDQAKELEQRVFQASSYDEALSIISDYLEVE